MYYFKIDHNEIGYHIHGKDIHIKGLSEPITPLYHTCHTYEECIKWLDKNYPNNYEIING